MFDDNFGLTTAQILRNLSSQLGGSHDGGEVKVTKEGKEYAIFIYAPVRGGGQPNLVGVPSFFELKTRIPHLHPSFLIRKSDTIDWVIEHVLSRPDYQVGDADFDSKFYISVQDTDWGKRFFSDVRIRTCIFSMLSQGFDVLRSEGGDLKVIKYLPFGCSNPSVDTINNAIEQLNHMVIYFPEGYVDTTKNENNGMNIAVGNLRKDLKDVYRELLFEGIDEKTKKRSKILVLLLSIAGLIAYWRLIAFHMAPRSAPPLYSPSVKGEVDYGFYFYLIYPFFLLGIIVYCLVLFAKGRRNHHHQS